MQLDMAPFRILAGYSGMSLTVIEATSMDDALYILLALGAFALFFAAITAFERA